MKTFARFALLLAVALLVPACGEIIVVQQGGNPTGQGGFGSGFNAGVHPDILFLSDRNVTTIKELFAADAAGMTLVNLSGPLVTGGQVLQYGWSPNHLQVWFIADKDTAGRRELYVVSAMGGTPVKVSGALSAGRDVGFAIWAPDNSRIAYVADDTVDDALELFSVLPNGNGRVKLSGTLPAGGSIDNFVFWAPNSSRIAFSGDALVAGTRELFTVLPDGSAAPITVSGAMVAGGGIAPVTAPPFFWAPDSSRIAYRADQTTVGTIELYTSLPTTSAGNVKVSGTMVTDGDVYEQVVWAPDSSRIAYVADQTTDGTYELHTTLPTGAGSVLKISAAISPTDFLGSYDWSPTSGRIAYFVFHTPPSLDLFTADPVTAGSGTLVHADFNGDFQWSPSGATLAFVGAGLSGQALFTCAPNGSGKVEIQPAGITATNYFNWSPSGAKIAYFGTNTSGVDGVYTINPNGTGNLEISASLAAPAFADFEFPYWLTDESRVVYLVDAEADGLKGIYASTLAGSTARVSGTILETVTPSSLTVR